MATRTASDLSAFVGDSKDNAIRIGIDMDASDVGTLVEIVKETTSNEKTTVNGNGKRKTISSSSSTPSSYASNKKRRKGKKKKKKMKGNNSHSSSKMQEDAPVVPVPAPPTMVPFGFVDVAYLVFTVIWAACGLGSLMVEESPDYETLRVQAFDELRSENASNMDFGVYTTFKSNLIALVKDHKDWKTTMDVKSYRSEREMKDGETMEGITYQSSLITLIGYMNWRVKVLADSKSVPALLDENKSIEECVKGLDFDYSSSGGSAKNYFIETLYVATTGQDLPSHFPMDKLGHVENGKEHVLKKEKMWKALCDTESSFLRKMVSALRDEQGDMKKAADLFWKRLSEDQQQALQDAATCVSAPDKATCKNFVMPDGKRNKRQAKCSPFTLNVNDDDEFEFVVPEGSDNKKNPHYVYFERPVEDKVREQIEKVMFGEESSDEVIKALYGVLSLVKRVKKGKGNPLRWKESFIDAMNAFVVTLNQEDEDDDDDDDASSTSEIDSDAGSESDSDDESVVSDDENDGDKDGNKGKSA